MLRVLPGTRTFPRLPTRHTASALPIGGMQRGQGQLSGPCTPLGYHFVWLANSVLESSGFSVSERNTTYTSELISIAVSTIDK